MTVRNKIFIVLLGAVALFLLSVVLLTRLVMESRNRAQEEVRVRDNISRVRNALDNEQAAFDRFANDF
jgi:sensor domain CHASE-containing protein